MAAVLASLLIVASASAATRATTFFPLAPIARPLALTAGPDGNVWFAGFGFPANFDAEVGRVTPSGQVSEFPLPRRGPAEIELSGIAAGSDGALWFTESDADKIGRITTSGDITEFPLPSPKADPVAITSGPDGALWFTEEAASKIGRITTAGQVTEYPLPTGSGPAGIAAAPDGALWFTEKTANKIGRITTAGTLTEYPLPDQGSLPRSITVGPDGNLWFTEEAAGRIGRITPAGAITQFAIPAQTGTAAIAAGPAGDIWFSTGREIGSISPSGQTVRPSCLDGGCRLPISSLAVGPEGNLWFGAFAAISEGGGNTHILSQEAPGYVGKFFPPPLSLALGPKARPVSASVTAVRLSCKGGAAGAECDGFLQLSKRPSPGGPRGTRRVVLGQRRYRLVSGESKRVRLHLTQRAVKLLSGHGYLPVRARALSQGQVEASQPIILRLQGRHRNGPASTSGLSAQAI